MKTPLMENNLVAHKQEGTSDKVYMACIRKGGMANGVASYSVLGKWGRRGKKLSSQLKWTGPNLQSARVQQGELFRDKLSEGYVDIDSASYRGPVTRNDREIAENMEAEIDDKTAIKPEKKIPLESERMADPSTHVAICVDRVGFEARFDEGIEYVFEKSKTKGMVWVYDKLGEKHEYFAERFRFIKGE